MKHFKADKQVGMKSRKVQDENKKSKKKKIGVEKTLENGTTRSKDLKVLKKEKNSQRVHKALKDQSTESNDASVENQKQQTLKEHVKLKSTSDKNKTADHSAKVMIKAKKQLMKQSTGKKMKAKDTPKQKDESSSSLVESSHEIESKDPIEMLSKQQIKDCISAIFHLTQEQMEDKKALFASDADPIFLQVTCIRVPKMPRFNTRIDLPYPLTSPNDEVALFVPDLVRGKRKEYEPTIEHYRELLNQHQCDRIKDIIPMNQVKTEYDQFELKRKLASSYDRFLVDSRIAGHMTHLLGKAFQHHSKIPTPVRMLQTKSLKSTIDRALGRTVMPLFSTNNHICQVGHTSMKKKNIMENVLSVCTRLDKVYPGGWENIRSIHLKGRFTAALPIYMTLKRKNDVKIPIIQPKRPKAYRIVEGELTTLSGNYKVAVAPEGDIDFTQISETNEDADPMSEDE